MRIPLIQSWKKAAVLGVVILLFSAHQTWAQTDSPGQAQRAALNKVNYFRRMVGLPEVEMNEALNIAAQAHAEYLFLNNVTGMYGGHSEQDTANGFTGEKPWDRARHFGYKSLRVAECISYVGDPNKAVVGWVNSVYHRFPIIDPDLIEVGYGMVHEGEAKFDVMDFGFAMPHSSGEPILIKYPFSNQKEVPVGFGGEIPNPVPTKAESVGYPITMQFKNLDTPEVLRYSLTNSDGEQIDCWLLTPESDPNSYLRSEIAIIPKSVLNRGETYTVSVALNAKEKLYEESWNFTTFSLSTENPDLLPELSKEAYDALKSENYKEAVALYEKVLSLEPNDEIAQTNILYSVWGLNDYAEQIRVCKKLLEINPENVNALNDLAYAYQERGEYRKAIKAYNKVLDIEPDNSMAGQNIKYCELKRSDEFIRIGWVNFIESDSDFLSRQYGTGLFREKIFSISLHLTNYRNINGSLHGLFAPQTRCSPNQLDKSLNSFYFIQFNPRIQLSLPYRFLTPYLGAGAGGTWFIFEV
ncbi:MAG: CAP domain-containing protein, partial [bacterium]